MNKYEQLKQLLKEYKKAMEEYDRVFLKNANKQLEELRDATAEEIAEETKHYNITTKLNKQIAKLTGINWLVIHRLATQKKLDQLLKQF